WLGHANHCALLWALWFQSYAELAARFCKVLDFPRLIHERRDFPKRLAVVGVTTTDRAQICRPFLYPARRGGRAREGSSGAEHHGGDGKRCLHGTSPVESACAIWSNVCVLSGVTLECTSRAIRRPSWLAGVGTRCGPHRSGKFYFHLSSTPLSSGRESRSLVVLCPGRARLGASERTSGPR